MSEEFDNAIEQAMIEDEESMYRTVNFDKAFSNGKWAINVSTVGQLITELQRLPVNLPVRSSFEDSVDIVIFNRKQDDTHLSVEDGGEWDCAEDE